jgi:hypothetical protein
LAFSFYSNFVGAVYHHIISPSARGFSLLRHAGPGNWARRLDYSWQGSLLAATSYLHGAAVRTEKVTDFINTTMVRSFDTRSRGGDNDLSPIRRAPRAQAGRFPVRPE